MPDKYIAVIGAGATALAATSYLLAEGLHVTLFEERSEPGGVWTNTDTADHPNPIYQDLETNVPRTLMTLTDHPWEEETPMFPPERAVGDYLKSYYEKLKRTSNAQNLDSCFDTIVVKLRHGLRNSQQKWKIDATCKTGKEPLGTFDAVVIAAGNYWDPNMPAPEPGRQLWNGRYPGTILHSQQYQTPDKFRNKNVVIVGNSASGWDISGHIAKVARRVFVSARDLTKPVNVDCVAVGMITTYEVPTRTVKFSHNVEMDDVDFVIYCTGYLYNFSFAVKREEPIFQPGSKVANLYKHIFYTQEPSLAFVGLPKMTASFTVAEAQSAVVARAFSGRLRMPSKSIMEEWEKKFTSAHVQQMRSDNTFHTLFQGNNEDREYVNELQRYATSEQLTPGNGKPPPYWCQCLDNARALSRGIRIAYMEHRDESEEKRATYTTYHSLGAELVIPCEAEVRAQQSEMDATSCFLDRASI